MKALVTGAGGFIGSHLVEYLVEHGFEVRAMVRYNSRSDDGYLGELASEVHDSVEIIRGDLRDSHTVRRAVTDCSHVFHLGALISIPYSYINPTEYVQVNVAGTANILEACLSSGSLERSVITSTSEVYGTAQYVPIDEEHPIQGQSPYSASKIGADHLAESYHRSFELPVAILRPFNTYGPRQSLRAIIPTIISQLLFSDTIRLGNLEPRRDLTYVRDTARGFYKMGTVDDAPLGEPVNIGNGKDISIGELLELAREVTGSDAELITDSNRVRPEKSEVMQLLCGWEKAHRTIDWAPEIDLKEGLSRTADWVRKHSSQLDVERYHV